MFWVIAFAFFAGIAFIMIIADIATGISYLTAIWIFLLAMNLLFCVVAFKEVIEKLRGGKVNEH